ncbi:MAG TPA: hypothetical protein VMG98_02670 [Verrucomicrobiae bacterium]|nr:hypothetical protein [Verrucomicrobiae bacterium]
MRFEPAKALAAIGACVLILGGCGGGSGSTSSGGTPPTSPGGTGTSASVGSQPSNAAIETAGGYSGTLTFPAASGTATVTITDSTTAPAGATVLNKRRESSVGPTTPLLYLSLDSNATVTLNGTPALTVTVPAGTDLSQPFYLAVDLPSSGWTTFASGTVSGQSVAFSSLTGSVVLTAGTALTFALYSGAPLPSALSVNPVSVQLLGIGATQQIEVSDGTLPASFQLTNTITVTAAACNGVTSMTTQSNTMYTFTGVAVGTCSATVSDSLGNVFTLPVSVTSTTVVAQ